MSIYLKDRRVPVEGIPRILNLSFELSTSANYWTFKPSSHRPASERPRYLLPFTSKRMRCRGVLWLLLAARCAVEGFAAVVPAGAVYINSFVISQTGAPQYTNVTAHSGLGYVWHDTYTCIEACTELFGGAGTNFSEFYGSVSSTNLSRTCHVDALGIDCNNGPYADDYENGPLYDSYGKTSAYIKDHMCQATNYCWGMPPSPPPASPSPPPPSPPPPPHQVPLLLHLQLSPPKPTPSPPPPPPAPPHKPTPSTSSTSPPSPTPSKPSTQFDGVDDYLLLPMVEGIVSISMWVKIATDQGGDEETCIFDGTFSVTTTHSITDTLGN
ncbi:hypothetical protein CYMTET_44174, partial [Cymbomonas tetramitiformis]